MRRNLSRFLFVIFVSFVANLSNGEVIRLTTTADIWLSDAVPAERNTSMGANPRMKLKGIQEMAAVRFDATPIVGREVKSARLFLKKSGDEKIRYLRLSTINQDWVEGKSEQSYGPPDGATWFYADAESKKAWSWPGSGFCDVIMTSGHSLASYSEERDEDDGWMSFEVAPALVYSMVAKDTDGLAMQDGGNLDLHNNFVFSRESKGGGPYLETEVGGKLDEIPAAAKANASPAPEEAHLTTGGLRIEIEPAPSIFCYCLTLDGQLVPRWRVPHPANRGGTGVSPVNVILDDLAPNKRYKIEIAAISRSGQRSPPTLLTAISSAALPTPPVLNPPKPPSGNKIETPKFFILPPLVKLSAQTLQPQSDDLESNFAAANSVWNGHSITLDGARGEVVSFQIVVPNDQPTITATTLRNETGDEVAASNLDVYWLRLVRNKDKNLQPAYAIPLSQSQKSPSPFVHVDLYIPKDAKAGRYTGTLSINGSQNVQIELLVYDFTLPDRLSFWPELNAYSIPKNHLDYFRLAHDHRCVANFWHFEPRTRGQGEQIHVDWEQYDRDAGPILSGEAFKKTRRGAIPVECMYLPYNDNWPTNLTPETYHYTGYWPHRGEDKKFLVEHSLTAPPIDQAFSADYLAAYRAVEAQFIDHFKDRGWNRTEMQCYFGGKQSHRINFGSNHWWTTDEPSFLHDWLALQYFDRLWCDARGSASVDQWPTRADISRPHWQGDFLDGVTQVIYYGAGGSSSAAMVHRIREHVRDGHFKVRFYGSCNPDNQSNLITIAWLLDAYLNGADGALPWQTIGSEKALDDNDGGAFGGNALLIPANRFNQSVVADLRLKAMRDAEQLIEYLHLLAQRRHLNREQLQAMVAQVLPLGASPAAANPTADTDRFMGPKEWQLADLRRQLARLILASR
jgi:hypothetical protein